MKNTTILGFVSVLLLAILVAALAPLEKTLGANARLVYFHGAWVWAAMLAFAAAAVAGAIGLLSQRIAWQRTSQAAGRTGLVFWLIFLPMALLVMQLNWNGIFWNEPRFRIPLNLAVVGFLLQVGLVFFPLTWTMLANMAYGVVFFLAMGSTDAVLHPDSPIFNSDARAIQIYFIGLLILLAVAAMLLTRAWYEWETHKD
jgi:membrane protein CcdC involved in cytochrome C biogenesis